nr:unnamed protein product [Callosobruchus chinensis]
MRVNASRHHCNMSSAQLIKSDATREMADYLISSALPMMKIPTACFSTKTCAGYQSPLV